VILEAGFFQEIGDFAFAGTVLACETDDHIESSYRPQPPLTLRGGLEPPLKVRGGWRGYSQLVSFN
jgi:hypothetical protein